MLVGFLLNQNYLWIVYNKLSNFLVYFRDQNQWIPTYVDIYKYIRLHLPSSLHETKIFTDSPTWIKLPKCGNILMNIKRNGVQEKNIPVRLMQWIFGKECMRVGCLFRFWVRNSSYGWWPMWATAKDWTKNP
jgi:hypothetical protein